MIEKEPTIEDCVDPQPIEFGMGGNRSPFLDENLTRQVLLIDRKKLEGNNPFIIKFAINLGHRYARDEYNTGKGPRVPLGISRQDFRKSFLKWIDSPTDLEKAIRELIETYGENYSCNISNVVCTHNFGNSGTVNLFRISTLTELLKHCEAAPEFQEHYRDDLFYIKKAIDEVLVKLASGADRKEYASYTEKWESDFMGETKRQVAWLKRYEEVQSRLGGYYFKRFLETGESSEGGY